EGVGTLAGEAAGDLRPAVEDRVVHPRGGDDQAVEEDADLVLRGLLGDEALGGLAEEAGALGVDLEVDDPVVGRRPALGALGGRAVGVRAVLRGAEMTRPSRTMPNWSCGACWATRRWEVSAKRSVPSELNSMLTTQLFVVVPAWVTSRPELAEATWVPSTSTGPRTNLPKPSCEHPTSRRSASSPLPPTRFAGWWQSRMYSP